jgi:hypothetical protein
MSVTVTLHIFSGRPDPAWELTSEQASDLAARLASIQQRTLLKPAGILGKLGYRGFSITAVREAAFEPHIYIHHGVVDLARFDLNRIIDSPELEEWLLSTAGEIVSDEVRQAVKDELQRGTPQRWSQPASVLTVPPFDPGKWNNDANIRTLNNCYNYANDQITNTFAQPGRGSGSMFTAFECGNVDSASRRDGQVPVASASGTPAQGHFSALVMWTSVDFHWYRLDANAMWSHKPGQTQARNTDDSGNLISDPRTCNRGNYTSFCGFYHCIPSNTRIL